MVKLRAINLSYAAPLPVRPRHAMKIEDFMATWQYKTYLLDQAQAAERMGRSINSPVSYNSHGASCVTPQDWSLVSPGAYNPYYAPAPPADMPEQECGSPAQESYRNTMPTHYGLLSSNPGGWPFTPDIFSLNFRMLDAPVPGIDEILEWNDFHAKNKLDMCPRPFDSWYKPEHPMDPKPAESQEPYQSRLEHPPPEPPKFMIKMPPTETPEEITQTKPQNLPAESEKSAGLSIRERRIAKQREGTRRSSRFAPK